MPLKSNSRLKVDYWTTGFIGRVREYHWPLFPLKLTIETLEQLWCDIDDWRYDLKHKHAGKLGGWLESEIRMNLRSTTWYFREYKESKKQFLLDGALRELTKTFNKMRNRLYGRQLENIGKITCLLEKLNKCSA